MKNYEQLLSGIQRNESGHIVSAQALQVVWFVMVNFTAVDLDKTGNSGGTSDFVINIITNFRVLLFFFFNLRRPQIPWIGSPRS